MTKEPESVVALVQIFAGLGKKWIGSCLLPILSKEYITNFGSDSSTSGDARYKRRDNGQARPHHAFDTPAPNRLSGYGRLRHLELDEIREIP